MSRPEPGWYATTNTDIHYIVVVGAYETAFITIGRSKPFIYTYKAGNEPDFAVFKLEKLNE